MIRGSNYLEGEDLINCVQFAAEHEVVDRTVLALNVYTATAVRNTVRPTGLGQDSCYTQIRIRYCEANVVIDMVLVTQPTLATMRSIPSAWYRIVKCSEITGLRIETRAAKTAQQPDIRSSHRTNLDGPTLHMQGRNNEHVFHHHALGVWSSDQSEPLPKPSHRLRHALLKSIYSHVYRANPPRLRNYTYIPRCSYSSPQAPLPLLAHTPAVMKVAVVGSGVAGLGATWALNEFSGHEVHLYEAAPRPGGHAHTVSFMQPSKDGKGEHKVSVDMGFIVFNPVNYPNFIRFLKMYPNLKEAILPTWMHFSVSRDDGVGEWAFKGLRAIFAQVKNVLDRNTWRMIYDILRFNACARRLIMENEQNIASGSDTEITIGEYLEREGYSDAFRDNMLIPMMAALYCTPPDICAADFPARTLLQFMENYHLLQTEDEACWMTLRGGNRTYVDQIVSLLDPSRLHVNTPVRSVSTFPIQDPSSPKPRHKVLLETADGHIEEFDHVIMACHNDATLDILRRGKGLTALEEELLSSFRWNKNTAVLHSDARLMPKSPEAWASWNYLTYSGTDPATNRRKANINKTSCTFWMNQLQSISTEDHGHLFVTMNPPFEPDESKVISRHQYDHAVVDVKGVRAQRRMHEIQAKRGISFAGAWMNYTFHEDGFNAGLHAALYVSALGSEQDAVRLPFELEYAERKAKPQPSAIFYDLMQATGAQTVIGNAFGFCLDILQALFLFFLFLFSAYEPKLMSALREPIMSAFTTPKVKQH